MAKLGKQLEYLHTLERFEEIKPGLQTMQRLLAALGNPHDHFDSIHIAGTNGKGSTAAMLASILNEVRSQRSRIKGLKVGIYTSPHLRQFNDRIQINGQHISDEELGSLISDVRSAADRRHLQPTFFEFTTAVAFLYFARQRADLAIIEVGMGGLLDATNVIAPRLAIITNIGTDHTNWLGTTRRQIAERKAGIIKRGIPVVTAEEDPLILTYFQQVCDTKGAQLHCIKDHYTAETTEQTLTHQTFSITSLQATSYPALGGAPPAGGGSLPTTKFKLPLLGTHQVANALTAIAALQVLNAIDSTITIDSNAIRQGLANVSLEGRLDIISRNPFILIDGAHNNESAQALSHFLDTAELPPSHVLVIAAKQDKKLDVMLEKIVPRFSHVICTEGTYQPLPAQQLANLIAAKAPNQTVTTTPNLARALDLGRQQLAPDHLMLITGSLYMIGDALKILRPQSKPLA